MSRKRTALQDTNQWPRGVGAAEALQALGLTEEERGRSFATPTLVYRECPSWRWDAGEIREFVHALAAVRAA